MDLSKLQTGIQEEGIKHLRGQLDFENVILPLLDIDPVDWREPWVNASCPNWLGLHEGEDANPSFGINTETLRYNCFVCGGGPLEDLVAIILGLDEREAVEWLEEHSTLRYVETPEVHRDTIERILARAEPAKDVLPDYPKDLLFQYTHVHPYVFERGISREVVIEKQIGFSTEHMGIVIPHFFDSKLVGIQFRHLAHDGERYYCPDPYCNPPHKNKVPKYKNTDHFPRGETLYNYDTALEQDGPLIVVESPFTALYLMSHGYRVVATFGSGMTIKQAQLLKPFDAIYLWPDNDPAGKQWFEYTDKRGNVHTQPSLLLLQDYATVKIVPLVPGAKSDGADVAPDDIDSYLFEAYPASLYPTHGLTLKSDDQVYER